MELGLTPKRRTEGNQSVSKPFFMSVFFNIYSKLDNFFKNLSWIKTKYYANPVKKGQKYPRRPGSPSNRAIA